MSASPGASRAVLRMNAEIDVRAVLPTIQVPALVLHAVRELNVPVEAGRYLGQAIPGAKYIELLGADHIPWGENADAILDEVGEFLTGIRRGPEPDRVLATVLFTDIVDATRQAAAVGDRRWRDILEGHHTIVREELARLRGRERASTPASAR